MDWNQKRVLKESKITAAILEHIKRNNISWNVELKLFIFYTKILLWLMNFFCTVMLILLHINIKLMVSAPGLKYFNLEFGFAT